MVGSRGLKVGVSTRGRPTSAKYGSFVMLDARKPENRSMATPAVIALVLSRAFRSELASPVNAPPSSQHYVSTAGAVKPPLGNRPFPFETRLAGRAVVICLCRRKNEVDDWGSCHEKNQCSCCCHFAGVSYFRSK